MFFGRLFDNVADATSSMEARRTARFETCEAQADRASLRQSSGDPGAHLTAERARTPAALGDAVGFELTFTERVAGVEPTSIDRIAAGPDLSDPQISDPSRIPDDEAGQMIKLEYEASGEVVTSGAAALGVPWPDEDAEVMTYHQHGDTDVFNVVAAGHTASCTCSPHGSWLSGHRTAAVEGRAVPI